MALKRAGRATDYNMFEGQTVISTEEVEKGTIMAISRLQHNRVYAAPADPDKDAAGRLMVAQHKALEGSKLMLVPWLLIEDDDVKGQRGSGLYLEARGKYSNAAGEGKRLVGRVLEGGILLDPNSP